MTNYQTLIEKESKVMARLHQQIHETVKNRDKDLKSWKSACREFHTYCSPIDPMINRVYEDKIIADKELQEFVITFLELDPMFFRSGYIKEEMLKKIKKSPITIKQKDRLRSVLKDAVEKRGTREFKKYCNLAIELANDEFISYLNVVSSYGEGARKSRAKLMLKYV